MATMKPFMMAAAALALVAMVLVCSAPPALAEGQEPLHADAEKTETSGEALQSEPQGMQKSESSEGEEKKWGRSPAWHKASHHHGHRGHHDDKTRSHHGSEKPSQHGKPPHYDHDKTKPHPYSPPHYDHDKTKPHPYSPPHYDHDRKKPHPYSPPY